MKSIPNVQNQGQCAKLCKETEGCKGKPGGSDADLVILHFDLNFS